MTPDELRATGHVQDPVTKQWFAPGHYRVKRAKADLQPDGAGTPAKLERNLGDGAVGAVQVQRGLGRRFLVRIKSFRKRLLDEDNLCEKYHCDLCRYAGALPSDAPGTATIEVTQEKVGPKEPERVEIEVWEL